jgi:glycyl-tRNA synthetase (class II)
LRDRDTTKQVRVKIAELKSAIARLLNGERLENIGNMYK